MPDLGLERKIQGAARFAARRIPPLCRLQTAASPVSAFATLRKPRVNSLHPHASPAPDHRHATPVPPTPPPPPPRCRRLHAAPPRVAQVRPRVLLLLHRLPRAPLLHALRRPQARRARHALHRRPARHPRRQLHRLRRPRPRRPHPPRGPPAARARPLRLLRRHPQGHLRPLRLPPGGHARLHRLLRLRRPHHPGLDPRLQRHPRRHGRRRRRRRHHALRAAPLRLLRRRRQRRARPVPDLRGGQGGHRARHRPEVPHHGHRRHERQRHGHRRPRRRGHHRRPAARVRVVVPGVHVRLRAGRGEWDLRGDRRPVRPVQLWSGQLGPVLRAGAIGGHDVLQHAVRQQQHDARQLHAPDDQRRLQRHLLQLRRIRERDDPHHVDHGAQAAMPGPAPVPAADPAADVVLLRDVPGPFADADAVRRRLPDDGRHGPDEQSGRQLGRSAGGPAPERGSWSARSLRRRHHAVAVAGNVPSSQQYGRK